MLLNTKLSPFHAALIGDHPNFACNVYGITVYHARSYFCLWSLVLYVPHLKSWFSHRRVLCKALIKPSASLKSSNVPSQCLYLSMDLYFRPVFFFWQFYIWKCLENVFVLVPSFFMSNALHMTKVPISQVLSLSSWNDRWFRTNLKFLFKLQCNSIDSSFSQAKVSFRVPYPSNQNIAPFYIP